MDDSWAAREMAHAEIGDQRSRENLIQICQTLAAQPGIAFSRACGEAKRKAAHRLLRNPKTTPQSLLKGHVEQTALRCSQGDFPLVLAASDTTIFDFTSHTHTKGLGPIGTSPRRRGFLTHSVLAMTPQGLPLGLLHQKSYVRPIPQEDFSQQTKPQRQQRKDQQRVRPYEQKESYKWLQALQDVESALPESQPVLLIQDREADIFEFMSAPRRANTHLLIRAAQPRRVQVLTPGDESEPLESAGPQSLLDAVSQCDVCARFTLEVGARPDQPPRVATLDVRYLPVVVLPSRPSLKRASAPESCPLWVIQVSESASCGSISSSGLCWTLLSTLCVSDPATALSVAGYYSRRWQVERFHYVLKSGCQIERLQMDRVEFLQGALSLYSVVSWWLLYVLHLSRLSPSTPAEQVLSAPLLRVASASSGRVVSTVEDLVFAVGKIGGFRRVPSAPYPGVKSLWLGLHALHERYLGWQLACASQRNAGQD
jgi:hypothetical protein